MKSRLFLLSLVIMNFILINNTYAVVATSDTKIDDSKIRWYNCIVIDYDTTAFNEYERGYSLEDFNNLPFEQKKEIDSKLFLFGNSGLAFGGYQNGRVGDEGRESTSGVTQGIAKDV